MPVIRNSVHPRRRGFDSHSKHHAPPPEDGGSNSESSSMRLAQLPAARPTRDALLQGSHPRIQPAARQLNGQRIRCGTPPPPQGMGGTPSHRRNTHLRQMRTTSHSHRPMGPRTHRQQTKLDRTRTQTLQQTRRPTQSNRKQRTLDTTLSQAKPQARRKPQASANASTSMTQTNQTRSRKPSKHTQQKQQNIHQTGKNTINQPANTTRG